MALTPVPKIGTIVPTMSTLFDTDNLSRTLFGKTRRAVLSLLYSHIEDAFYLRQIVRTAGAGLGAVQRELKQLSDAGIIQRFVRGHQVYYQANPRCPIFAELKNLVVKTIGVGAALQAALAPLADRIDLAVIYGSIARSEEHRESDVDVLVVGKVTFAEVVSSFSEVQKTIGREINPTVYPLSEFRSKLAAGHHFLNTVLRGPMLFLIGEKRDLAGLAKKPLAR
jgi:predicted nucleotidyltransferase